MNNLTKLFQLLWGDYLALNPDAKRIFDLLTERGEQIVNDHIALRTFNEPRVDLQVLAKPFLSEGYEQAGSYQFPGKHLDARHFEHPDSSFPRIFISQLQLEAFSPELQKTVTELLEDAPEDMAGNLHASLSGRPWNLSFETYENLRKESEYAAWMGAFGFRPNHFTILVNSLNTFPGIRELVEFLKENGFEINASGGEIKGSTESMLEQASTLANRVAVTFSDGVETIPSCYYEFAQRHPMPNGELFSGFLAQSADKIFESTDKR
tara:strand:+ start:29813 stop:30610 length:798 start_codon:yes stop_codon:yes gene_type:complete